MALSKEREDILTKFFFAKLWPMYPDTLCGGSRKKGPRGEALKSWLKIAPDDAEMERISRNLQAQVRADLKEKDPARWPYMTTYLNQRRYDDEMENRVYDRPSDDLPRDKICRHEGCKQPVHGPRFSLCEVHLGQSTDRYAVLRKQRVIDLGLMPDGKEPRAQFYARIKHWCKTNYPTFALRKP